ncbi:MAG: hypothetical protein ABJH44_10475, partial [Balneola sp.]
GLYVKGKILLRLEQPSDAIKAFTEALEIGGINSRLKYRIGRTNEQHLDTFGLDELYQSFDINPSSACCARVLKKYMKKRKIKLPVDSSNENPLILSFIGSEDKWKFDSLYEKYLSNKYLDGDFPFGQTETLPVITSFINEVREKQDLFVVDDEEYEDRDYYDYHNDYTHPHDSPYYNDDLDMDQQSPEFWDSL